jgi:hypothetical protein
MKDSSASFIIIFVYFSIAGDYWLSLLSSELIDESGIFDFSVRFYDYLSVI